MPWTKLSDDFHLHRKTKHAGLLASGLDACLMTHSAKYLTDGIFEPDELDDVWAWGFEAETQLFKAELAPCLDDALADHPEARALVEAELERFELDPATVLRWALERLQDASLVEKHGRRGKLRLHNYLDYNLSREQWEQRRAQAAERQARHRGALQPRDGEPNELATLTVHAEVSDIAAERPTSRRDQRVTSRVTSIAPEEATERARQEGGQGSPDSLAAPHGASGEHGEALSSQSRATASEATAELSTERLDELQAEAMHGSRSGQNRPDRAHLQDPRPVPSVTRSDRWTDDDVADSLAVLRALRTHPSLAPVAIPECSALAVSLMQEHKRSRRAAIGAIGELARDAMSAEAVGRTWSDERMSRMLAVYVSRSREPEGQGPLSEADHAARKRAEAKRWSAEERERVEAKKKALPLMTVASLVGGLLNSLG